MLSSNSEKRRSYTRDHSLVAVDPAFNEAAAQAKAVQAPKTVTPAEAHGPAVQHMVERFMKID